MYEIVFHMQKIIGLVPDNESCSLSPGGKSEPPRLTAMDL